MTDDFQVTIAPDSETAFWMKVEEEAQKRILGMQREIIINEAIIELAQNKINKEEKNGE